MSDTEHNTLHQRLTDLEVTLALVHDALNFDAGDWTPESVEHHLREQIALARQHLEATPAQNRAELGRDHMASFLEYLKSAPKTPFTGGMLIDFWSMYEKFATSEQVAAERSEQESTHDSRS